MLDRATIRDLTVWDPAARGFITLQPGVLLETCRIRPSLEIGPHDTPAAYVAEFIFADRVYRCPLYSFQPRTRVLDERGSAREALTA